MCSAVENVFQYTHAHSHPRDTFSSSGLDEAPSGGVIEGSSGAERGQSGLTHLKAKGKRNGLRKQTADNVSRWIPHNPNITNLHISPSTWRLWLFSPDTHLAEEDSGMGCSCCAMLWTSDSTASQCFIAAFYYYTLLEASIMFIYHIFNRFSFL